MCTVTFVKYNDVVCITSNRDEKVKRPKAIPPKNYRINNKNIFFPKDAKAGGTWYAVDEYSNVIVLLNGAVEKHEFSPKFQKSRGLVVLDLISSASIIELWQEIDLTIVEPFTLVVYEKNQLFQLQWDGERKKVRTLDDSKSYIWSSATLYSPDVIHKRKNRFAAFLDEIEEISADTLFNFHSFSDSKNEENGLIINRNNETVTLSITQTVLELNKVSLHYHDLTESKLHSHSFIVI